MATETPNFSIAINVAGAAPYAGPGQIVEPKTGLYDIVVKEASLYTKEETGNQSIKFVVSIAGGEYAGSEHWIFVGLDTEKPGIQRAWATAFHSLGFTQAQIDAGITITGKTFANRKAFMNFKASDPETGKKANREFATPTAAKAFRASQASTGNEDVGSGAHVPEVSNVTVPAPTGAANRLRGMAGK
jgi:hypothetical protein